MNQLYNVNLYYYFHHYSELMALIFFMMMTVWRHNICFCFIFLLTAMNICNWLILLVIGIMVWCTYDHAGGKWVKMKRFQESLKERQKRNKRPSGRRNWRQRYGLRRVQEIITHQIIRLSILSSCMQIQ